MECPECGSNNVEVIKERGRQITLRCLDCGNVWQITLPKTVKVPLIVSEHEKSYKTVAELPEGEEIRVGDIVEIEEGDIRITGIELEGMRRVEKAVIGDIKTLWGENISFPAVFGVSIYLKDGVTQSFKVKADREEEFATGEVIEVGGYTFKIERIRTENGTIKRGIAKADEIKRLMGHAIRGKARRKLEIYRGHKR
ncbi:HVO_0476 family zinc finger protein [Palaeococcus sp. (in: euryarchaeotes)]